MTSGLRMPGRHVVGLAVCERIARNAALRRSAGLIAYQLALGGNDLADPTLREAHHGPQMRDGVALGGRPYHFFARCSRSAATSNICSASSFFSLAFVWQEARCRPFQNCPATVRRATLKNRKTQIRIGNVIGRQTGHHRLLEIDNVGRRIVGKTDIDQPDDQLEADRSQDLAVSVRALANMERVAEDES